MPAKVLLKDIVDSLEMQSDEFRSFLNLDTGAVETVSLELLSQAEEGDEENDPDPDDEEWELAKRIVSSDRFVRLPTQRDIHEWEIMQDFAQSVSAAPLREELLNAIHGSGAFRFFKSVLRRHRIEQQWFAFRDEALRQIAVDWCEEHQIVWQ